VVYHAQDRAQVSPTAMAIMPEDCEAQTARLCGITTVRMRGRANEEVLAARSECVAELSARRSVGCVYELRLHPPARCEGTRGPKEEG